MEEEAANAGKTLGFDQKHMPDKEWMLLVISTLNPLNDIFSKNYQPPHSNVKASVDAHIQVSNKGAFFEGLPASRGRGKIYQMLVEPEQYKRLMRERLRAQQRAIMDQLEGLEIGSSAGDTTSSSIDQRPSVSQL